MSMALWSRGRPLGDGFSLMWTGEGGQKS